MVDSIKVKEEIMLPNYWQALSLVLRTVEATSKTLPFICSGSRIQLQAKSFWQVAIICLGKLMTAFIKVCGVRLAFKGSEC